MKIEQLIEKIRSMPECSVKEPDGLPALSAKHILPKDLQDFYTICGGMTLFENSDFGFSILSPHNFKLANPIIIGELCEEDISSEWYTICKTFNGDFLTIDLNGDRLGKCYDSFWDRHGVVGECSVVANNLTELIYQIYVSKGEYLFWLQKEFNYLGDAYDNV